jgi:predicted SAM-dependent methyltransferase
VGAGWFPIDRRAVTVDIRPETRPDFVASILSLPFADETSECTTAFEILEHIDQKNQAYACRELARVTKRGGIVAISVPYSVSIWGPLQRVMWAIRERSTQREYHGDPRTHAHVAMITPFQLRTHLRDAGLVITESRRIMGYTYFVTGMKE